MKVIKAEMWHITGIFLILLQCLNFHMENQWDLKMLGSEILLLPLVSLKERKLYVGSDCLLLCTVRHMPASTGVRSSYLVPY